MRRQLTLCGVRNHHLYIVDAAQMFQLKSVMVPTVKWFLYVDEPYYYFIAPNNAPPCEVYNFYVTATYVGATYTGAGCSVPSSVISRMLPSLPDVDEVESSLRYSLTKHPERGIVLWVSFMVCGAE